MKQQLMDKIRQKTSMDHEYIKIDNKFEQLLKQIGDAKLSEKIRGAVATKECTYAHIWYKQGLFDGVKASLNTLNKTMKSTI